MLDTIAMQVGDTTLIWQMLQARKAQLMRERESARADEKLAQEMLRDAVAREQNIDAALQEVDTAEKVVCSLMRSPPDVAMKAHPACKIQLVAGGTPVPGIHDCDLISSSAGGAYDLYHPFGALQEATDTRSQKATILKACERILADGRWETTEKLVERLELMGINFTAANKAQRLSQILSADQHFLSQRGRGWSWITDTDRHRRAHHFISSHGHDDTLNERLKREARRVLDDPTK